MSAPAYRGGKGQVTQIPDSHHAQRRYHHPVPDLTGYITEGRSFWTGSGSRRASIPISVLPSLSRLMKDGIGKRVHRADHPDLSNQLFASYAKVQDARVWPPSSVKTS